MLSRFFIDRPIFASVLSIFATLAGLVHYAASDPIDLRVIMPEHQSVVRTARGGLLSKLISAVKTGY